MKLPEFIRSHKFEITREWTDFAGTFFPQEEIAASTLKNNIEELLDQIADDMEQVQSIDQQILKARGERASHGIENISEVHAIGRIQMGLSSKQLISEFRVLRASIIRLWQQDVAPLDRADLYDLIRFNEAIDEIITEVEIRYSTIVNRSRELFLGVLGHDLRNPIAAISAISKIILREPAHKRNAAMASQISISADRAARMINDLIELTRVQLGNGIPLDPGEINLGDLCWKAITEMQAIYPDRSFEVDIEEELYVEWDQSRIDQVLSNLLGNAAQHGKRDTPITLKAGRTGKNIEVKIHNQGPVIPSPLIETLFDKFVQGDGLYSARPGGMGLGLYIAKEIVTAHGGTISVESSEENGTTFSVSIPQTFVSDPALSVGTKSYRAHRGNHTGLLTPPGAQTVSDLPASSSGVH